MSTIYISDRIYIPATIIEEDTLQHKFVKQVYEESKCQRCPYLAERHSETCDDCPAYKGLHQLYNEKKIKGKKYFGIGVGNRKFSHLLETTKGVKVKDKRATPAFKHPIEFIRDLYDYQKPAVESLIKKNNGILFSPPRSGKTIMTVAAVCGKKMRTLIMASQYDWLNQFYDTIMGNEEKGEIAFTNIPELEEETGKKICVLAKDGEPLTKYKDADIVLSTYQRFLSDKGKKQLNEVRKLFGVIILDEVDTTPATQYSKVVNAFTARSRIGCTGTITRKDGRHYVLKELFGKVIAKTKVETLKPKVTMIETGINTKKDYKVIAYAYRFLADHNERNKLIVDWVKADLKAGRHIVIPTQTVKHCKVLVDMINKKMGKDVACVFTAGAFKNKEQRNALLADIKSGRYKVTVGIRRMLQRGINIPKWDTLYTVMPIANEPNYTQETNRILTPLEGKPQPIIRHFIEGFGLSTGCLRTCVWQVYVPLKFNISGETFNKIKLYGTKNYTFKTTTPKSINKKSKKSSKKKSFRDRNI